MTPRIIDAAKSVFSYGAVSVLSLALELTILQCLVWLHTPQVVAVSLAFISASVFQFCTLRYVVFQVTHRPVLIQVNAYVIAAAVSWAAVVAAVSAMTALFGISTMLAREISIPLLFPFNYLLNRYFIFRR